MDVKVTGARELADAFERMAGEADQLDLSRVGDLARAELAASSPRLTGALSRSWQVEASASRVSAGSDLIYAAVQNYGSGHVPALHFVEPVVELVTDESGQMMTEAIDRLIARL